MDRNKNPFKVNENAYIRRSKAVTAPTRVEEVDRETGEVMDAVNITLADKDVDMQRFIKVYDLSCLAKLSSAGLRMFMYVAKFVGYDNKVLLSRQYFMKKYKYKQEKSYYNAIDNLIDAQVIKKCEGALYWVNPNILCRGKR